MPRVLALVPFVGRPLIDEVLLGATLAEHALSLAARTADDVAVVTDRMSPAGNDLPDVKRRLGAADAAAWVETLEADDQVAIHDPMCPLVPEVFVRRLLDDRSASTRIAVRPVVDTVKAVHEGQVRRTIDREQLRTVASPVVTTGSALARIDDLGGALTEPRTLVEQLRVTGPVALVEAPAVVRRIEDLSDIQLVAAIAEVRRREEASGA